MVSEISDSDTQDKEDEDSDLNAAKETDKPERDAQRTDEKPTGGEQREELLKDNFGDYRQDGGKIAYVVDDIIMDGSFNQTIYKGIQMYALGAGVSFSCYQVA